MFESVYKIVPLDLLSVFEPHEMEMILYGVPFIDAEEWKSHTDYKGVYNINHPNIKWFWEIVLDLSQDQLRRLLHFSTGSSRTPVHGFKYKLR